MQFLRQRIVYYWRPACSCGWKSERIFHLGEEKESNLAFDCHSCQSLKGFYLVENEEKVKRYVKDSKIILDNSEKL